MAGRCTRTSFRKYGLHVAVNGAGIDVPGKPRLRSHDLQHTYASLLIAQGVNITFASRQLGHASVSTTLNVYTHLFDHVEHAATVMERLEGRFGNVLTVAEREPRRVRRWA
jgi:integrase